MTEGLRRHFQATALLAAMLVSGCAHTPKKTWGDSSQYPAMGQLTGRVTDEHGAPIQYATVRVLGLGMGIGEASHADGKYDLNVPVGTHTVRCIMYGYVRQSRDSVHVSRHHTTVMDFKLQPWPPSYRRERDWGLVPRAKTGNKP